MHYRSFLENKLYRDKIITWLESMGSIIELKTLNNQEYDIALREKILEEVKEIVLAKDKQELISEIADVLEVIDSLIVLHGISKDDVTHIKKEKNQSRGGFFDKKFVTVAHHIPNSTPCNYYIAEPEKHPEVTEQYMLKIKKL
jgi:predicted house-cleaning noncanonical NTP pyrophosphatase (MazG superfamily)